MTSHIPIQLNVGGGSLLEGALSPSCKLQMEVLCLETRVEIAMAEARTKLSEFVVGTTRGPESPASSLCGVKGGAIDTRIVHLSSAGSPSIVIGMPTRHVHAHACAMSLVDTESAVMLLIKVIKRLGRKKVEDFAAI